MAIDRDYGHPAPGKELDMLDFYQLTDVYFGKVLDLFKWHRLTSVEAIQRRYPDVPRRDIEERVDQVFEDCSNFSLDSD